MALAFLFESPGFTQEHYDQLTERLPPDAVKAEGRIFHLAGPMEGGWRILDVWESQEAFNAFFRETLGPTFQELGLASFARPPQVWSVHNMLIGSGPEHSL
jgi:hypothetical protein